LSFERAAPFYSGYTPKILRGFEDCQEH